MSFWGELRRRNVVRVGIAYVVVSWLVIQVADTFLPALRLPDWTVTFVAALLILGLPVALALSWAYELTAEGLKKTDAIAAGQSIARVTGRKIDRIIMTVLALAVAFLVVDNYMIEPTGDASRVGASIGAPTGTSGIPSDRQEALPNSIAVLPLDNLSPDPNNAFVAAGLHEEILNQLAKLRLNVIARTSVLQYAEDRPPIGEIAAALRVQSVMEGSVRYAGDRIRVTTQLIDAATGSHIWSETYDRQFDDIFAIESDIAMNVANALAVEFSLDQQEAIETPPTRSPEAYALFLQAANAAGGGAAALALLERAIALDPEFALAYARRANVTAQGIVNSIGQNAVGADQRDRLIESVRADAARAAALDPTLATPHWVAAIPELFSWRWSSALASYDRAAATPGSGPGGIVTSAYAWLLGYVGRHQESETIARRTFELNPADPLASWSFAVALTYAGKPAEAAEIERAAIALAPIVPILHSWLGMILIQQGELDAAASELRIAEQLVGDTPDIATLTDIAYGYARTGRAEDATRLVAKVEEIAGDRDLGAGTWALTRLAIGDDAAAARWLETAIEKAERHEIDAGFWALMNIRMNFAADPVLERADLAELRGRLRGD